MFEAELQKKAFLKMQGLRRRDKWSEQLVCFAKEKNIKSEKLKKER